MRRIAHQRHPSDGPSRERVAVVERPTICSINRANDRADLGMPSFEFLERVGDFALRGPRFDAPFAGSDRDPVVIARAGTDEIVYKVMVRPPPDGSHDLEPEMCYALRRNQPAICDV